MSLVETDEKKCSRGKIIAYLDGELKPQEEIVLEKHIAICSACLSELNLQKQMFFALDSVFSEKEEIKLPENFAKVVATHAETNVKGLRSRAERFRAFFLCLVLLLLGVVGLGVKTTVDSFDKFAEKIFVVISFIGHIAYDLMVGVTVILRSFGKQPGFDSAFLLLLLAIVFFVSVLTYSRYIDNSDRS
jgi:anti-sigma factor RsiW